jgi:hypothetical protein
VSSVAGAGRRSFVSAEQELEARGVAVVVELRQRLGFFGDVAAQDRVAGGASGQSHSMTRSKKGRRVRSSCRWVLADRAPLTPGEPDGQTS